MATKTGYIEQLFKAHFYERCCLGIVLLHDEDESKDIVHNIFARLLEGDISFNEEKSRSFLLSSMRNRCLNARRSRTAREQALRLFPIDDQFQPIAFAEESVNLLQEGINKLTPPSCREIVLLHYRDNRTFKEIAALFQVSETTIYNHLRDAINQLHSTFKELG